MSTHETKKMDESPVFVVRFIKNSHGNFGPVLCWAGGGMLRGQSETELVNRAGSVLEVRVSFFIGTGPVEIEWMPGEPTENESG